MKNLIAFIVVAYFFLISSSCTKKPMVNCNEVEYGVEFTIEANHVYCFSDGYEFEVTSLKNEFCCCFCVCVWEGQIVANLILNDDAEFAFQTSFEEVPLPDNKIISMTGYELLVDCENGGENPPIKNIRAIVTK